MIHIAMTLLRTHCNKWIEGLEVESPVNSGRDKAEWCKICLNAWENDFATKYQTKDVYTGRISEGTKEL